MINLKISSSYSPLSSVALQLAKDHNENLWDYLINCYPEISKMTSFTKNDFCRAMKNIKCRLNGEFISAARQFQAWWPINKAVISELFENFFSLQNREQMTFYASLGVGTICPRDIANNAFIIPYLADRQEFFQICSHEISHFYFFKKMEELSHDNILPEKKEIWTISEILVPCLLNSETLKEICGKVPYQCYAANNQAVESCRKIYVEYWENQRNQKLFWQKLLQLKTT